MLLHYKDPHVLVYIGNKKLEMLLSQKTPFYYAFFGAYDRALPRICETLKKIDNGLTVIDIGANIGDTASLISEKIDGASILCIEGDENFLYFLLRNIKMIKNNNIVIEPYFCVDKTENNQLSIESKNGTAHLSYSGKKKLTNVDTLDNILKRNDSFGEANLLKIDTDGFEITVLNGAKKLLGNKHPMIFFEFTPEAYIANKQNAIDLIELLKSFGYNQALFYDNFGVPVGINEFNDSTKIQNTIRKIDNNKIYYYDVLCIHKEDENKYYSILEGESNCGKRSEKYCTTGIFTFDRQ
jgi:FkbM family methyltransferase